MEAKSAMETDTVVSSNYRHTHTRRGRTVSLSTARIHAFILLPPFCNISTNMQKCMHSEKLLRVLSK